LILRFAGIALLRGNISDHDERDFYGHAYYLLLDRCHDAIIANDGKFLADALDLLLQKISRNFSRQWTEESGQCLADTVALSGMARIYSELLGDQDLWRQASDVWEKTLANSNQPTGFLNFVHQMPNEDLQQSLSSRARFRSLWRLTLQRKLMQDGFLTSVFGSDDNPFASNYSPFIRALLQFIHSSNYPTEVFIAAVAKELSQGQILLDGRDLGSFYEEWNEELIRDTAESQGDIDSSNLTTEDDRTSDESPDDGSALPDDDEIGGEEAE
jgi:hypothetical protein